MSRRSSRFAWLALAAGLGVAAPGLAQAQDRLFVANGVHQVEIGAIGRFGQILGPAPADAFTRTFPRVVPFTADDTTVRDARTGAVVYAAPGAERIAGWAATPDAARLYVATSEGFAGPVRATRAVDVNSGTVIVEVPMLAGAVVWLPGDRVLVDSGSGQYRAFDRELRPIGQVSLPSRCAPQWLVSEHSGRAYFVAYEGYTGSDISAKLVAFDTVAGRQVGEVHMGPAGCFGGPAVRLWTAPGPPLGLSAAVTGRDVSLSWLPTELAEGYVVDVGVAPGRTDLTMFVGATTAVTFAGAPSGTYYVRIRAGNSVGGGRPSSEARVVVP